MAIKQTLGSAASLDSKLIHLYNIEQPLIAYGIDVCSFHEYIDAFETNVVFFIRFDSDCVANLNLSGIKPKYIDRLYPGICATTKETDGIMNETFSKSSIDCIVSIVSSDYIVIDDLLSEADEEEA